MVASEHYFTAPLMGICLLLMACIAIHLAYTLKRTTKKIMTFYKVLPMISIVSFILSTCIDFGDLVYYFATGIDVIHTDHLWLIVFSNFFYGISSISLYIVIFGRLYFTFKYKAVRYQMNRSTIYFMIGFIVLNAVIILFYTLIMLFFYQQKVTQFYFILKITFIILDASDLLLTIFMLVLFVYKLQQIIVGTSFAENYRSSYHLNSHSIRSESSIGINSANIESNNDIELNTMDIKLITIITRHSILSSVVIIFNQVFYISVIVGSAVVFNSIDEQNLYFLAYSNLIKAVLGVVNAITLYLNFGFNILAYRRYCNGIHIYCYNYFEHRAKEEISQQRAKSEDLSGI